MKSKILDGRIISSKIKKDIKRKISNLEENKNRIPGLAAVYVGDDKGSLAYVNMIKKNSEKVGMKCIIKHFENNISQEELLKELSNLNKDSTIDGIIIQLPLPSHINEKEVLANVDFKKDIDGVNYINAGKFYLGEEINVPCTPKGIIKLIEEYDISIEGKKSVVVGRSNILGKPLSLLMLNRNATVEICHSRTHNLKEELLTADIVISCVGKPNLIKSDMVKNGAIVIDAGINNVNENIVGDVKFNDVMKKTSWITPVPGGVGPMTIAMLLENTMEAYFKNGIKTP